MHAIFKWIPVLVASSFLIGATRGGQEPVDAGSGKPKMDPAAYMALMNPGPEHELLAKLVGTWEEEYKMWMQPGMPTPMTSTGTTNAEMILGGRFLQRKSEGVTMGTKVESLSFLGFDRRSKEYTTVGLDTMGTYFITAAGSYDAQKKQIDLYGEDEDPAMGVTQKYHFYITLVDDDTVRTELVFEPDAPYKSDKPFKMVEITSKRVK